MREAVFEVTRIVPPRCTYPDCTRDAIWKIRMLGGRPAWTLVCGTHRIAARRLLRATEIRKD